MISKLHLVNEIFNVPAVEQMFCQDPPRKRQIPTPDHTDHQWWQEHYQSIWKCMIHRSSPLRQLHPSLTVLETLPKHDDISSCVLVLLSKPKMYSLTNRWKRGRQDVGSIPSITVIWVCVDGATASTDPPLSERRISIRGVLPFIARPPTPPTPSKRISIRDSVMVDEALEPSTPSSRATVMPIWVDSPKCGGVPLRVNLGAGDLCSSSLPLCKCRLRSSEIMKTITLLFIVYK